MSDRVVIRCPSCKNKLGLKKDKLGQQIKCPGCGTVLATRMSAESSGSSSSSGKRQQRRRSESSRSVAGSSEASSPRRKSRRSSPAEGASKKRRSSSKRVAKPDPVPLGDDIIEDDWGDESYDVGEDALDWGDESDLYSAEDDGENWLETEQKDDWNAPAPLPAAQRKKKKKKKSAESAEGKKKKRSDGISGLVAGGGVMVWVTAGLIAGVTTFSFTIACGYTGVGILVRLASLASGAVIGGTIRATSGETEGWGPGLVALAIAVPVIVFGRIGAIYVFPNGNDIFGLGSDLALMTQDDVDRETSEDGMIANLVDTELYYDDHWWATNGITEDNFHSRAYENSGFDDRVVECADRFDEKVWVEGQRRWNELSDEARSSQTEERRLELMMDNGLIDDAEFARIVERDTTDEEMTLRMAFEVESDEEWLKEAGVTLGAIEAHYNQHSDAKDPEDRIHPKIWEEASRRWAEMDDDAKDFARSEVEDELMQERQMAGDTGEALNKGRMGIAVFIGFVSLIYPFRWLFLTLSSMFVAFKIASRMASG